MKKISILLGILAIAGILCGCDAETEKEVSDVVDCGIGVKQTQVLKQVQQQIPQMNEQHNRELEEAMQ